MTIVTRELIESARLVETADGFSGTRAFMLEDVPGNREAQLYNASLDPNIPVFGAPHPVVPEIQVTSRSFEPRDDRIVFCQIDYEIPDEGDRSQAGSTSEPVPEDATIRIGGAVVERETNFDVNGNPLIVTYTGTVADDEGNFQVFNGEEQVATVSFLVAQNVIGFSRKESFSPLRKSLAYKGYLNAQSIGIFDAGTLLCTALDGTSDDGGRTFTVEYEFQYDPDGWDQDYSFIDTRTGRPPPDVTRSNGIATAVGYSRADFYALNLPW